MGVDYGAEVYYGIIKSVEDIKDDEELDDVLEELISKNKKLDYSFLDYDSEEAAVVGKKLSSTDYFSKVDKISKKEMAEIDKLLGEKGSMICNLLIY